MSSYQQANKQRKSANEVRQTNNSSVLKIQYNIQIRAYLWLFKWLIRVSFSPTDPPVSRSFSIPESSENSSARVQLDSLNMLTSSLVDKALSPATHKAYKRVTKQFLSFVQTICGKTMQPFPASPHLVMSFIADCYNSNLVAWTVLTYISALSYFHKIRGFADPTQNFVVKKCLQGYHKDKSSCDHRKPITIDILHKLVASLNHTTSSHFSDYY